MQEMRVQFQDGKDPLEEGMAAHYSILAWEIPWTEEPDRPQPMGVAKSRTGLSMCVSVRATCMHARAHTHNTH